MKKNINYKNLNFMALMLLMTTGCAHQNIVKDARFDRLLLKDIKTGKERVYECSNAPSMQSILIWIAPGDTVALNSNCYYARSTTFTPENSHLSVDYVELQKRKNEFEQEKIRSAVQMEFAKQKTK